MGSRGERVRVELHSTDASSGVAVVIYPAGSNTARTLASTEYLVLEDAAMVTEIGGDIHLFLGADATPGAGESVLRGTVNNAGGISKEFEGGRAGARGHTLWAIAPAGKCDVVGNGYIQGA